jgi:hypothetical protein
MGSDEVSLISVHPFFRRFVFSIIQNVRTANLNFEGKSVIHADLVPMVSEKIMMASMVDKPLDLDKKEMVDVKPKKFEFKSMKMGELVAPIERVKVKGPVVRSKVTPPRTRVKATPVATRDNTITVGDDISGDYGAIVPLLADPSVSSIDCKGAGQPVMVIRAGQKQMTRIVLSKEDIDGVLKKVAEEAHIPLLEGVFRASVSEFSINAVISETLGSKFLIRKVTAYNLLE